MKYIFYGDGFCGFCDIFLKCNFPFLYNLGMSEQEEQKVPTTKEELIEMLKDQLEKVEVCLKLSRMRSLLCKAPSNRKRTRGRNSLSN